VAGVRAGQGRALVLRGEPGAGKTVLLDYLAGQASGCLVARAAGVQSQMELAFTALQNQLYAARRVERQPGGPFQERGRRHETTAALCPACGLLKFGGNFLIGARRGLGPVPGPPVWIDSRVGGIGQRAVQLLPGLDQRRR